MRKSDFHDDLPPELIACRLLCLDGGTGKIEDQRFADLPTTPVRR